jgi:hypothetical protein
MASASPLLNWPSLTAAARVCQQVRVFQQGTMFPLTLPSINSVAYGWSLWKLAAAPVCERVTLMTPWCVASNKVPLPLNVLPVRPTAIIHG